MPKILINSKICDQAPECGGIEICPNQALRFDEKTNRIVWEETKCTFCLKCTLPSACPVGAIAYARNQEEEQAILDSIAADPHSADWLWEERYGVMPAKINSRAKILTSKNYDEIISLSGCLLIDIWREEDLDCRLHSALYADILKGVKNNPKIFKLDAHTYPKIAEKLGITKFPSLLIIQDGQLSGKIEGHMSEEEVSIVNRQLIHLLA